MRAWIAVVAVVIALTGCDSPSETAAESPAATTAEPTAPTEPTEPPEPAATAPTEPTTGEQPRPGTGAKPASWVMPNLVGRTLQDAQDAIQELTDNAVFFTTSEDATGQGRTQVVDSNWMVCSQSVPAGQTITAETQIRFGAVKVDEGCP